MKMPNNGTILKIAIGVAIIVLGFSVRGLFNLSERQIRLEVKIEERIGQRFRGGKAGTSTLNEGSGRWFKMNDKLIRLEERLKRIEYDMYRGGLSDD